MIDGAYLSERRKERDGMPVCLYDSVCDDETPERFGLSQTMSDPPLTRHLETGLAIRRIPAAPSLPGTGHALQSTDNRLSDNDLEGMAFSKYDTSDKDVYLRPVGKGPGLINAGA